MGQSLTNLARFGVHSMAEETEKELASLVDETGLVQCLTTCLTGPTESGHQRFHLCDVTATAEDVASSTARLVFEWCAQVTNHCIANNGLSECPEKPESWLCYVSSLLQLIYSLSRAFLNGRCDTILLNLAVSCAGNACNPELIDDVLGRGVFFPAPQRSSHS